MPPSPRRPWVDALILAAGAVILAWPVVSFDLWWHLAAGRDILAELAIPREELYSHTLRGAAWIDFEWLFQALAHLIHEAGGFAALVWVKAAVAALGVLATYRSVRLAGGDAGAACLGAVCVLALVRTRCFVRPEAASLLLAPLFMLSVLYARFGRAPRSAQLALCCLLPFASALWANLHGGFVLGLALLGLSAAGAAWERGAASGERPLSRLLLVSLAACAGATLLNPYGLRVYEAMLLHVRDLSAPGGLGHVEEWRALRLSELPVFWGLLLATAALLGRDLIRKRPEALFWTPLLLGFALWASQQVRNPVYFAFVSVPYVFGSLGRERSKWGQFVRRLAPAAALIGALWLAHPLLKRDFGSHVRWVRFPRAACAFLESAGIEGTLFNSFAFGGYINWRFAGARPVFYDGRYIFHRLQIESAEAAATPGGFKDFLEARGVTYALVGYEDGCRGGSPWSSRFPNDRWALAHWDDTALVFLRRLPRYSDAIAAGEYRLVDPDDAGSVIAEVEAGRLDRKAVLEELHRHRRRTGFTVIGDFLTKRLKQAPGT